MTLEFSGEIADLYQHYRHGYPTETLDQIVDGLGLDQHAVAVDLGCGTGQLTIPLARRVHTVIGLDPEPDMLARASQQARLAGVQNACWMLGGDQHLPVLRTLLGGGSIAALTVAQALHWMDHRSLFAAARPLLRDGGGIAILSNGVPLWLHDTIWSKDLKRFLERWLDTSLTARCGTDSETQQRYAHDLARAGYEVTRADHGSVVELDFEHLAGGVLSALPASLLPRDHSRQTFMTELRNAVGSQNKFQERVPVTALIGRCRTDPR